VFKDKRKKEMTSLQIKLKFHYQTHIIGQTLHNQQSSILQYRKPVF